MNDYVKLGEEFLGVLERSTFGDWEQLLKLWRADPANIYRRLSPPPPTDLNLPSVCQGDASEAVSDCPISTWELRCEELKEDSEDNGMSHILSMCQVLAHATLLTPVNRDNTVTPLPLPPRLTSSFRSQHEQQFRILEEIEGRLLLDRESPIPSTLSSRWSDKITKIFPLHVIADDDKSCFTTCRT